MKITIHRGTHEIGGTCIEIRDNESRIVIDVGMPLVDKGGAKFDIAKYAKLSGPDLVKEKVLPDIKGIYSWDKGEKPPDGLFISHAHIDHYGFYNHLRSDLPVYLGEGTAKLINLTALFLRKPSLRNELRFIKSTRPVRVGCFRIIPSLMDHSAFDSHAFMVESGGTRIIYSGDFRAHGRKKKLFYSFLSRIQGLSVDALLIEGTVMSGKDTGRKTDSEDDLKQKIVEVVNDTNGIVFVAQASQNIDRIVSCFKAAITTKRMFVIDLYTAYVLDELKGLAKLPHASDTFRRIRVFYPRNLAISLSRRNQGHILDRFRAFRIHMPAIFKRQNEFIMLYRPSMNRDFEESGQFTDGCMIYSMASIYLQEKSMQGMHKFVKEHNLTFRKIHTSGHADICTLKYAIDHIQPGILIPVHTMNPDAFKDLYPRVKVASDREEIII